MIFSVFLYFHDCIKVKILLKESIHLYSDFQKKTATFLNKTVVSTYVTIVFLLFRFSFIHKISNYFYLNLKN
jgi:hypothetical protein